MICVEALDLYAKEVTRIKLKLEQLLTDLRVKPRTVEKVAREDLGYKLGENTVYRVLSTDSPKQVNLETLTAIIHAIRHHTGRDIQISDVLEYEDGDE